MEKILVNGEVVELNSQAFIHFFKMSGLVDCFIDDSAGEKEVDEEDLYEFDPETYDWWEEHIKLIYKFDDMNEDILEYEECGWLGSVISDYKDKISEITDSYINSDIGDLIEEHHETAEETLKAIKRRRKILDEIDKVGMEDITDEMLDEIWASRPDDFDSDYNHYCFYDHKWYSFYLSTFGKGNKFLGIPEENAEDFYFSVFRDWAKGIYFTAMKDDLGNYYENFEVFCDRIDDKIENYIIKFHKLPEDIFYEKKDEFKADMNEIIQENFDKFEEEVDYDRPEIYHHKLFETWDEFFDENIEEEE